MIDERIIARIAELYYLNDMDQYEIANRFNFSKAKVCRIIKEAKKNGIIQFTIKKFEKRQIELEKKLEEEFGLKEVIIYFNSEGKEYDENLIFQEVGILGANYFKRILKNNTNIALTWGKTLYYLIKNIHVERQFKLNIFSTLGGVSLTKAEYQNNNLIQMLCDKIGGICYPIYLPLVLEKKEYKEILTVDNNIKTVLGDASKIDYYFSGLGAISERSRMYTLGGFTKKFLKELIEKEVYGEIGLNFFDKNGKFVKTSIDGRTVHFAVDDLRKIKNKVVITFGESKVRPLLGFLKTGIADVLITDSVTAESMLNN
jgi:DNA-binding transcriptional regulator LsrR (DeoR family)